MTRQTFVLATAMTMFATAAPARAQAGAPKPHAAPRRTDAIARVAQLRARAGLQPGDIVTGFADDPSAKLADLYGYIRRQSPGTVVQLEVWRSGKRLLVPIAVGQRPRGGS